MNLMYFYLIGRLSGNNIGISNLSANSNGTNVLPTNNNSANGMLFIYYFCFEYIQ
jgi:hypothetical protein